MKVRMVSTREFWNVLCIASAFRTSRLSAAVGNVLYVTLEAPEDVPGFIGAQVVLTHALLGRR